MQNIQTRPVRDLRNNYAEVESLLDKHDPVIITKNGRGAAALINIENYAQFEEYQHFMYVAEKLDEAASPASDWQDYKVVFRRLRKKYHDMEKETIENFLT